MTERSDIHCCSLFRVVDTISLLLTTNRADGALVGKQDRYRFGFRQSRCSSMSFVASRLPSLLAQQGRMFEFVFRALFGEPAQSAR
jgi:hypothetical protein